MFARSFHCERIRRCKTVYGPKYTLTETNSSIDGQENLCFLRVVFYSVRENSASECKKSSQKITLEGYVDFYIH